ncbi:MAG: hypothetical protein IJ631_06790 [Schwartzia sp.]|nr:hypothetical protein [Schwartzia sp. (in: firmicutes)]
MNVVIVVSTVQQLQIILDSISLETIKVSKIVLAEGPFAETMDIGFNGRHFQASSYEYLEEIVASTQYDFLFVSDQSSNALLGEMGIPTSTIVNLTMLFFPVQLYEKVRLLHYLQRNIQGTSYKIFVTGLSYAYHGTDLSSYSLPTVNLSGISQDLYYDFSMAKRAMAYPQQSFRYAVIGLAPYSFHSDLSRSAENWRVPAYALALEDTHHFPLDSNQWRQLMYPLITRELRAIEKEKGAFDFNDPIGLCTQMDFVMGSAQRLAARKRAESWKWKRFPCTVKENKDILRQYIRLCHEKQILPILVIFPVTDIFRKFFSKQILEEFYGYVDELQKEENVLMLDYFASDAFSHQDFYDIDHLNRTGAKKVSSMIDEQLRAYIS